MQSNKVKDDMNCGTEFTPNQKMFNGHIETRTFDELLERPRSSNDAVGRLQERPVHRSIYRHSYAMANHDDILTAIRGEQRVRGDIGSDFSIGSCNSSRLFRSSSDVQKHSRLSNPPSLRASTTNFRKLSRDRLSLRRFSSLMKSPSFEKLIEGKVTGIKHPTPANGSSPDSLSMSATKLIQHRESLEFLDEESIMTNKSLVRRGSGPGRFKTIYTDITIGDEGGIKYLDSKAPSDGRGSNKVAQFFRKISTRSEMENSALRFRKVNKPNKAVSEAIIANLGRSNSVVSERSILRRERDHAVYEWNNAASQWEGLLNEIDDLMIQLIEVSDQ